MRLSTGKCPLPASRCLLFDTCVLKKRRLAVHLILSPHPLISLTDVFHVGNCFRCSINKRYSAIEVVHEFFFEAGVLLNRAEEVTSEVRNAAPIPVGIPAIGHIRNPLRAQFDVSWSARPHSYSDTRKAIDDQRRE